MGSSLLLRALWAAMMPTILALAGVPPPAGLHGRAVLAPAKPTADTGDDPLEPGAGRVVYAESFFGHEEFSWAPLVSVRRGDQKWIGAPVPERYDLESDPAEGSNLAGGDPDRDDAMRALLESVATSRIAGKAPPSGASGAPSEDLLARLQSLGYGGGGGDGRPVGRRRRDVGARPKERGGRLPGLPPRHRNARPGRDQGVPQQSSGHW